MNIAESRFDKSEWETQYNLRLLRPDYETAVVPDWVARSEEARATLPCTLDVPYGTAARARLDVFPAADPDAPILIYFHGGYWQRGDKTFYSFLAKPFTEAGITLVLPTYTLCPEGSITQISEESRQVVEFVWRNPELVPGDRKRITVMGHSAGGHITGVLMATDWTKRGADLPLDLLHAGIPVSALNDLDPLRATTINDALRMTDKEVAELSPMYMPPVTNARQFVVVGGRETEEFHRQSDNYKAAFETPARPMERYDVPDSDHFDELNVLANPTSEFFLKCIDYIRN